jgi:hypothetical protein
MAGTFTNEIKTVNMDGLSDFERIDTNLRSLMAAIACTIPGSRGFGLDIQISDQPPELAMNDFAAQLDEKVLEFMPEIRIADIEWENKNGVLSVAVYVEENDEYEEGDDEE